MSKKKKVRKASKQAISKKPQTKVGAVEMFDEMYPEAMPAKASEEIKKMFNIDVSPGYVSNIRFNKRNRKVSKSKVKVSKGVDKSPLTTDDVVAVSDFRRKIGNAKFDKAVEMIRLLTE